MSTISGIFLGLSPFTLLLSGAHGQSMTASTDTQVWPEAGFHLQLPRNLRVLALSGLEQGVGFPYQQWYAGGGLGFQFLRILRPHPENIDPDKEHYFLFGGGYEFFRTVQSGSVRHENRGTFEVTAGFRPLSRLLLRDRNRVELRSVDGAYSTRYRNMLVLETDFVLHRLRFTPYGSAEVFYNGAQHSWDQEYYTAGVQWQHKRRMMLDTYYRRENCPSCNPARWNVAGATLHFYFRKEN
jgi:hypothetical protein